MRVGLNLLHALPEIGGGWNYIQNLLRGLAADPSTEYVAFANRVSAELVPSGLRVEVIPLRAGSRGQRLAFEHSALQILALRRRLDCMHWFANGQGIVNAVPGVVTVYDMQPFLEHAPMPRAKRAFLRWNLQRAARRAAWLLPMSQTTAEALTAVLGADPNRMTVVPPQLESTFRPSTAAEVSACRETYRLPANFFLYVAHLYPHKNHARLLQAYQRLRQGGGAAWPLVFRGDQRPDTPGLQPLVKAYGLEDSVTFLPRIPTASMPALYGAASALIFPSLYEGAGIPVLEAQACGCAVVGSDIPAVREFAGDAAHYVDPLDVDSIARGMRAVAEEPALAGSLRERGLARAESFRSIDVLARLQDAYARASRLDTGK